jgi:hypothetical protein
VKVLVWADISKSGGLTDIIKPQTVGLSGDDALIDKCIHKVRVNSSISSIDIRHGVRVCDTNQTIWNSCVQAQTHLQALHSGTAHCKGILEVVASRIAAIDISNVESTFFDIYKGG